MNKKRQKQSGAALIMLMVVAVLALTAYLLHYTVPHRTLAENQSNEAALSAAAQALLGYAQVNSRFGEFPCPDLNNDGTAESACTAAGNTVTGLLPWKTLNLVKHRDGKGFPLWYILSSNYSNNTAGAITAATAGQIVLDGTGNYIALLIAPGAPVFGQSNRPTLQIADYAEDDNADGDTDFVSQAPSPFNDTVRGLMVTELFKGSFSGGGTGGGASGGTSGGTTGGTSGGTTGGMGGMGGMGIGGGAGGGMGMGGGMGG